MNEFSNPAHDENIQLVNTNRDLSSSNRHCSLRRALKVAAAFVFAGVTSIVVNRIFLSRDHDNTMSSRMEESDPHHVDLVNGDLAPNTSGADLAVNTSDTGLPLDASHSFQQHLDEILNDIGTVKSTETRCPDDHLDASFFCGQLRMKPTYDENVTYVTVSKRTAHYGLGLGQILHFSGSLKIVGTGFKQGRSYTGPYSGHYHFVVYQNNQTYFLCRTEGMGVDPSLSYDIFRTTTPSSPITAAVFNAALDTMCQAPNIQNPLAVFLTRLFKGHESSMRRLPAEG